MYGKERKDLQEAWIRSAKEDLITAKELFKLKRYSGTLFFCHLALEKILKAVFIKNNDTPPPFTHKLAKLAKEALIKVDDKQIELLNEITTFNIEARYDILKDTLYKKANKQFTQKYLQITKELFTYFYGLL